MTESLSGWWKVSAVDMVRKRAVRLIGGLPGEVVEFTTDNRYVVWDDAGPLTGSSKFRHTTEGGFLALDIWIPGLEALTTRCIYRTTTDALELCIAGDSGPRPTEFKRDDERLWCLVFFSRCEKPVVRARRRRSLLRPGKLIPDELLGPPAPRVPKRRK